MRFNAVALRKGRRGAENAKGFFFIVTIHHEAHEEHEGLKIKTQTMLIQLLISESNASNTFFVVNGGRL